MKATKAIILKHSHPKSEEYASTCAKSCDDVGLPWSYYHGYTNMTGKDAWGNTGIPMKFTYNVIPKWINESDMLEAHKANCASAGHAGIWNQIAQGPDEAVIVLEHDALMLHPLELDIPENRIAVLGYKVTDPTKYDHVHAGPTEHWADIKGHEGAHAYAITKTTAKSLVAEIESFGVLGAVDNAYFIRGQRRTVVPLVLSNPISAICWLRESTIWKDGSAARNYTFVSSFERNYRQ